MYAEKSEVDNPRHVSARLPIQVGLLVFGVVLILGVVATLQRALGLPEWVGKLTLALTPLVPAPILIGLAVRGYRRLDEMQQRIQGEAIIWGFVLGSILAFTWGSVEMTLGLPHVGWIWVWPVFGASWLVGLAIANRSYS